jgi:hypothetical protein
MAKAILHELGLSAGSAGTAKGGAAAEIRGIEF